MDHKESGKTYKGRDLERKEIKSELALELNMVALPNSIS